MRLALFLDERDPLLTEDLIDFIVMSTTICQKSDRFEKEGRRGKLQAFDLGQNSVNYAAKRIPNHF